MKRNAAIIAAVAVVIGLGFWGYSAYRTYTERALVHTLVADAGERLQPALVVQPGGSADFDAAARTAHDHVTTLRKLHTDSFAPLADAADGYLVGVREILRRRAAMHAANERVAQSLAALTQHVQSDRGAAGWPKQGVALKENVDRDLREYRIAVESYAGLLESFPETQKKVAAHVKTLRLADEKTINAAREGALEALTRANADIRKVTQLDAYRGGPRQRGKR